MKKLCSMIVALAAGAVPAHAGGMAQISHSAAAAGVADAYTATASDASAVIYNPAAIAWLPGVTVTGGLAINYRDSSVKTATAHIPNNGSEASVGHIYASWAPLDSNWGMGFAFAPLYHINNDWSTAGFSGTTKLMVDHAAFNGVYAVNSSLSFALGVDWYLTRATFVQGVNNFDDNDFTTFGAHAAMMWRPAPAWQLGVNVRSGAKISVSGVGSQQLDIKLPDEATFAVARDFADVWRLEADVKWTRWSALKNMNITNAAGLVQTNTLSLKDTVSMMTGLTWTWYPGSQLRFGYAYDQGANKSSGYHPIIADQDGHRATLGIGAEIMNAHMDLAYSYTFYGKKTATGPFAGEYRDRKQAVVFSVTKTFD